MSIRAIITNSLQINFDSKLSQAN